MQFQIRTSNLDNMSFRYIDRFSDIVKLATATKAQVYYADAITNKIYGFYEEGYSIIELDCPFKISNSILFSALTPANRRMVENHPAFFYLDNNPFFLYPENRRGDIMNDNIEFKYGYNPETDDNEYMFKDKMTGRILDDCIFTFDPSNWFRANQYINIIKSYNQRCTVLSEPIVFENMQNNEVIKEVISNKVSQGVRLLVLNSGSRRYGLYIFKSLLGPLTKQDKLTIYIRNDRNESNKFMITFRVTKKKTKLDIPEVGGLIVDTHAFILNLL